MTGDDPAARLLSRNTVAASQGGYLDDPRVIDIALLLLITFEAGPDPATLHDLLAHPRGLALLQTATACRAMALQANQYDESNSEYGTSGGVELTDELIERLAGEAEEGYAVERLRPRSLQVRLQYDAEDVDRVFARHTAECARRAVVDALNMSETSNARQARAVAASGLTNHAITCRCGTDSHD